MNEQKKYFDANQKLWDAKTAIHLKSAFYDMDSFLKTKNSLNQIELEELPDVKGKRILHSQCHFGQDTLSLQQLGAECVGFDLSPVAIAKAQELNKQLDLKARFVVSNVYELDKNLKETFDMIFTSYGVIGWLPDLNEWAKQLLAKLEKGGLFFMTEFHPIMYMYDWDSYELGYSYFNTGSPTEEVEEGTYADRQADIKLVEYFWQHSLEEIINSLIKNGLSLTAFREYDYSPYQLFKEGTQKGEKQYTFQKNGINLPLVFTLKGIKK